MPTWKETLAQMEAETGLMRERGEPLELYLERAEEALRLLEASWGDWLALGPRRGWERDPYLSWAWPAARDRARALRRWLPRLRRLVRRAA